MSCSDKDDGPALRGINLELSRSNAVANETVVDLITKVFSESGEELTGIDLSYFVDDVEIEGPSFIPNTSGRLTVRAEFNGTRSNNRTVDVIDLTEPLQSITLYYHGYRYLTTNPWSLSGFFTLEATANGLTAVVPNDKFDLYDHDTKLTGKTNLQFDESGTRSITARLEDHTSNAVEIFVREEKKYAEITIPVIFHTYAVELNRAQMLQLIDTLNGSFNPEGFSPEAVRSGRVNPNAVSMNVQFELATRDPQDNPINTPGLNIVQELSGEVPELDELRFLELEKEHLWDPDQYLNVWMVERFVPMEIFPLADLTATGLANLPILNSELIEGLQTGYTGDRGQFDPETIEKSIVLFAGSVLGEHRDYIVRTTGSFFGLFSTLAFSGRMCPQDSDYCEDTFTKDYSQEVGPNGEAVACDGTLFFQNNHMSAGRRYTNFTYSQRERVRAVLADAYNRP